MLATIALFCCGGVLFISAGALAAVGTGAIVKAVTRT